MKLATLEYDGFDWDDSSEPKRCLFVAFVVRLKGSELLIRPISARYTHKKEKEAYEHEIKKLKENK